MTQFYVPPQSIDTNIEILQEAQFKAYEKWCDELDCSKSWRREPAKKNFEQIIELCKGSTTPHFVFIDREDYITKEHYIEAGVRVCDIDKQIDYFIFCCLRIDLLKYFIDKYELKPWQSEET